MRDFPTLEVEIFAVEDDDLLLLQLLEHAVKDKNFIFLVVFGIQAFADVDVVLRCFFLTLVSLPFHRIAARKPHPLRTRRGLPLVGGEELPHSPFLKFIHDSNYHQCRKLFPDCPSQVIIRAKDSVYATYKALKTNKTLHSLEEPCELTNLSIRLDKRLYTFLDGNRERITTKRASLPKTVSHKFLSEC